MINFVFLLGFIASNFLVVRGNEKMVGPGKWSVINIMKCDEDATMVLKFEINRRKINRTHDGFNAKMNLEETIDENYALRVDICKYVDGGCKPYQVMMEDSFERFVKKYASNNLKDVLTKADIDPPDFPVPQGEHELKNYVFNYDELPTDGPYGEYGSKAFMIKDGIERGCVYIHAKFEEVEDEEEDR
ncbi:uncharacterized protein [Choristoneura fumiferana]|uniref:uncharacterized protein n=1 Tax=Choristoneura fumiferana TaxID=7141 RepID=UPI003D15E715